LYIQTLPDCSQIYSLVIDAGSTGSRVHVYRFSNCNSLQLTNEVYAHTKPGLGSFAVPSHAADSLEDLMKVAIQNVPTEYRKCTPLTLRATAGLRMLGSEISDSILAAVKAKLETYPFPIAAIDGVSIMDGSDEGVYAWITVNYLLGHIGSDQKKSTVGVLDMGGGSTQIVFEHNTGEVIQFGQSNYPLYGFSYDGYGLMEARKRIIELSKDVAPCIPIGKSKAGIIGTGNGFRECKELVKTLFDKSVPCAHHYCTFDGVAMPRINSYSELYAFSYFYDNFAKPFGLNMTFKVGDIAQAAELVCDPNAENIPSSAVKEFNKNKAWCMDLVYMYTLLSHGYGLPDEMELRTAKKINGIEVGWALGAAIRTLADPVCT
jgi:guanosine-diphosphatase